METNPKNLAVILRTNIQKITQNINQIENLLQQIGTPRDSSDLRSKITNIQVDTKDLLSISQKKLKEFHNFSSSQNGELKLVKERLTDELIKLVQRYQVATKLAIEKERSYELIEKKPTTAVFTRNELNSFDTSRFQEENETNNKQNQLQLDYSNHELILERQKKFKQLEGDIVDLNSMFKDLAVMVHDQGEIIDNIENNIESTQVTVVEANKELVNAKTFQSKARRKKFIIALIIFVILIVIAIIVVLTLHPWSN